MAFLISAQKVDDTKDPARQRDGWQPYRYTTMTILAQVITKACWSPCIWQRGYRKQDNFVSADLLVFDFDSGEYTLDEAVNDFQDMRHVIGTTRSHQVSKNSGPPCDRFRVVLQFDSAITTLHKYRYNMHHHFQNWPCDRACKDGARFFFPCNEIISINDDGMTQGIHTVPETFEAPISVEMQKQMREMKAIGAECYSMRKIREAEVPSGWRNQAIFKVSCDMAKMGHDAESILAFMLKTPTLQNSRNTETRNELPSIIRSAMQRALKR